MGFGDDVIASGLARGAVCRGKRIAFGDGKKIIWRPTSYEIFRNNPNIAAPGSEGDPDIEWIAHYRGCRMYGDLRGDRWHFRDFRCPPGEIYFDDDELAAMINGWADRPVIIEPTVKDHGACAGANKQWPLDRYLAVAEALARDGEYVISLGATAANWPVLPRLVTPTFREALIPLACAKLYIGPEGGLHHAAAALGIPAVVIFGGFNTPRSTGYPWHTNLTASGDPCGRVAVCDHCRDAMASISTDRVLEAARSSLCAWNDEAEKKRSIM